MKKLFTITILLFLVLLQGCEKVNTVNPQISYKEYIVVRAKLKAYEKFGGVSFTKTLPLDEKYDITKAELKNVTAYLQVNGVRIIPLHYTNDGIYQPIDTILIQTGSTYELFARVNNTTIYSITKVPVLPKVESVSMTGSYLEASVASHPGEVFGAAWEISDSFSGGVYDKAPDFQQIVGNTSINSNETISVRTTDLPDKYQSSNYGQSRFVKVYAFDEPYLRYFNSRNNNQPVSNAFVQGGDQMFWNVQGNNVIGLFIGEAEGNLVQAN